MLYTLYARENALWLGRMERCGWSVWHQFGIYLYIVFLGEPALCPCIYCDAAISNDHNPLWIARYLGPFMSDERESCGMRAIHI